MKHNTLLLALFSSLFLISCHPQLPEGIKKIKSIHQATNWQKLRTYPINSGRSDDLHFFDPQTGFIINSNGYLSYTEDGGKTWEIKHENEGSFFRCLTFKNRQEGWLGTIGTDDPYLESKDTVAMYETKDGGESWQAVVFHGPTPKGLCGLQKVTDQFIVGCGRVRGSSYFIKTIDGGQNWHSYDLNHLAGSLIATHFFDESHGFMIGGTTTDKINCRSLVLETQDGGITWDTAYISKQKGEYCWKFSFPTRDLGFISIQRNVRDGDFYHLRTEDGGQTWKEVLHSDAYYYVQGISFITPEIGWIGGSNNWTYQTNDGGKSWKPYRGIGKGFNNFQYFGDSLIYGVGFGVFKSNNLYPAKEEMVENYFKNGLLKQQFKLRNGIKQGLAKNYHPNGKLASIGKYKKNLKTGGWKYYNENGHLLENTRLKNGIIQLTESDFSAFLGNYEMDSGEIRRIYLSEGQLYSQRSNRQAYAIFPESKNRFFYDFNPSITIEFIQADDGRVSHSRSFQNGRFTTAKKVK